MSGNMYAYNLCNVPKFNMKQIEDVVANPQKYPEIKFDTIYEHGQTILHILCIENRQDLLEKIGSSFNINFFAKNESDQTLFDVISVKTDISSQLLYKMLLKLMTDQMREIKDSGLSSIKTKNTLLQEQNNKLFNENRILQKQTDNYKTYMMSISVIFFIVLCPMMCKYYFDLFMVKFT